MRLAADDLEEAQLGLAPLLDVVLLLLIFFLVTTSFAAPRMDLELPEAQSGEIASPSLVVVTVEAAGGLGLDGEAVTTAELAERFASAADAAAGVTELVVRADTEARHGQVVEVLDLARSHGLTRVGIEVAAASGN